MTMTNVNEVELLSSIAPPESPRVWQRRHARLRPGADLAQRGASLTEYALLVALIAVACIGTFQQVSNSQEGSIGGSASKIASAMDSVD